MRPRASASWARTCSVAFVRTSSAAFVSAAFISGDRPCQAFSLMTISCAFMMCPVSIMCDGVSWSLDDSTTLTGFSCPATCPVASAVGTSDQSTGIGTAPRPCTVLM